MHLFLSPHPDDAALSCGGLIYTLVQAGEEVSVLTVMAGDMPSDTPPTPYIEEHIRRWALGADPVPGRRAEDARAMRLLRARLETGSLPDLLYRTDGQGGILYPDRDAMFGEIDSRDPVLNQHAIITSALEKTRVAYVPLGAGHHVDHQVVRNVALDWAEDRPEVAVFLYEEYPYSADGADIVEAARAELKRVSHPVVHYLSEAALKTKIEAIACYRSQISTFWDSVPTMATSVRQYAIQVGNGRPAERVWQLVR